MASGKSKIAILVVCTLLVGCGGSPNTMDASGLWETVGDTDSSSVDPSSISGLPNDEDIFAGDKFIAIPQSVIDSILSIDDNAKKKLSDRLGFFSGETYDGYDGYDEEDEDGKKIFSNGYATRHTYTLDTISIRMVILT